MSNDNNSNNQVPASGMTQENPPPPPAAAAVALTPESLVAPSSTRRSRQYSSEHGSIPEEPQDEDDEVRRAKAMAEAISQNPGVHNPDDVRALVQQQPQQSVKKHLLIPGRLAHAFNTVQTETATASLPEPKKRTPLVKSLQESFRSSQRKRSDSKDAPVSPRSSPSQPHKVTSPLRNLLSNSVRGASSGHQSVPQQQQRRVTMPVLSSSSPTTIPLSHEEQGGRTTPNEGNKTPPFEKKRRNSMELLDNSNNNNNNVNHFLISPTSSSEPVRLSAIAWKRRSGLGKLSATKAWERRRFLLQGPKVMYYFIDEEGEAREPHEGDETSYADSETTIASNHHKDHAHHRKSSWFEHAAERARAMGMPSSSDPTTPRGVLDVVKERATVAAASGHSGAPSPFALSIKVKGDTYWKICFDTHGQQMEWLAALTHVVVASSVDSYNSQLLVAADPSHEGQLFHTVYALPPPPEKPTDEREGGHRLWTMEEYYLACHGENGKKLEEPSDKEETAALPTNDANESRERLSTDDEDVSSAVGLSPRSSASFSASADADGLASRDTWSIREKDVYAMVVIVNVALVYSHSSSTSAPGFWYVVTFANLGLWFCLASEEEKRKIKDKRNDVEASAPALAKEEELAIAEAAADNVVAGKSSRQRSLRLSRGGRRPSKKKSAIKSKSASAEPKVPGFKPEAGTTTVTVQNPTDLAVNTNNELFAAWRKRSGGNFSVRSRGYLTTKTKIESPGELYECTKVDIFESPNRYPDMSPRVHLPTVDFQDEGPKTWRAPDIFVVSISLPTDPPKLRGPSGDGGGYTVTMYMTMKQDTRDILRRVTADDYDPLSEKAVANVQKNKVNAVKLFEEWCRRAPTDPAFQGRFKLMVTCENLKEIGIPSWIGKYNGKPVLIKRAGVTGFLYPHPDLSALEFDISFHAFPYLAKQAICYLKEKFFKKVLATFGFVIEGRSDDELPECVIGAMQLCYPDPAIAIQGSDFFAGTSKRSF